MVSKPWVLVAVVAPFVVGEVAVASSQAGAVPIAVPAVADADSPDPLLVARRRKRRKKSTPPADLPPVKIRTVVEQTILKKGRKKKPVYLIPAATTILIEMSGYGNLALVFHQQLSRKKSERNSVVVQVAADGRDPREVKISTKVQKRMSIETDKRGLISKPGSRVEKLGGGDHRIEITGPAEGPPIIAVIEFYAGGSKHKSPVVIEEAAAPDPSLLAAAMDFDDDDDAAPPPPAAPPPVAPPPAEPAEPAEPAIPPTSAEPALASAPLNPVAAEPAVPSAKPLTDVLAAVSRKKESIRDATVRRVNSGEIRDGLLGEYPEVSVVYEKTGETTLFGRVGEEKSYSIMVGGPGELVVRVHRIVDPAKTPTDGGSYSIVILENDVLLQQLSGTTERSSVWLLQSAETEGLLISEPKEYRLKVGAKKSALALQIADAPEGMLIRYTYAAETATLAAMDLGFDDEDDEDDMGFVAPVQPTVVMEVDVREALVIEEAPSFLAFGARVGAALPMTGANPGLIVGGEAVFTLPFLDRMFAIAATGAFMQNDLGLQILDPTGAAVDTTTTVMAVPVVAKLIFRMPFGEMFTAYADAGGGISYVRVERQASGTAQVGDGVIWALRGGLGSEIALGPGQLGLEAAYFFAPAQDYGNAVRDFTPTSIHVAVGYRIEI